MTGRVQAPIIPGNAPKELAQMGPSFRSMASTTNSEIARLEALITALQATVTDHETRIVALEP